MTGGISWDGLTKEVGRTRPSPRRALYRAGGATRRGCASVRPLGRGSAEWAADPEVRHGATKAAPATGHRSRRDLFLYRAERARRRVRPGIGAYFRIRDRKSTRLNSSHT